MAPMSGRAVVTETLKSIIICVDSYEDSLMKGYIYHASFVEGKKFDNLMQLLLIMEDILDETGFPMSTTEKRRFSAFDSVGKSGKTIVENLDFASNRGKLASFKIRVMFRQNASWQGTIAWIECNADEPFRSVIEMLLMMDSALKA